MQNRLPDTWIIKIFNTMHSHYGNRWLNMWKLGEALPNGLDAGLARAMDTWAEKLGPYSDKPEAIKKVLANLPVEPPTLPMFLELVKNCYIPTNMMLSDTLTEEQKANNRAKIKELLHNVCKKV